MSGSFPMFAIGRPYRVLLLEDDGNDVELIQRAFKEVAGAAALHVAYNGQEGIDHLSSVAGGNEFPDLIVCDINMPLLNGFDFLHWLKQSPQRRTPVVMLTSSLVDRDVARAYDLGAAGYLVKPPAFEELKARVRALMNFWTINQPPPPVNEHVPTNAG
ncbi:MAG TPA: response regulator [Methylomirabilota bacterium]|nr:response regulator [Methylomirabilota bacterium]